MKIKAKFSKPENGCGVVNLCRFHTIPQPNWENFPDIYGPFDFLNCIKKQTANAGWAFCAFSDGVNSQWVSDQKLAYEWMSKNCKLVYQSPVRINKNTGNDFFFCIFDIRSKK